MLKYIAENPWIKRFLVPQQVCIEIFRRLMKGKFNAYAMWTLVKKFQNWIVDQSTACDFTVNELQNKTGSGQKISLFSKSTFWKPRLFFWNKNDGDKLSRCKQISNRRTTRKVRLVSRSWRLGTIVIVCKYNFTTEITLI